MRVSARVAPVLALLTALLHPGGALAKCRSLEGFPIHQCAGGAFFAPPPEGSGAVTAAFWQIGFGNAAANSGEGTVGIGVFPAGVFNGNDSGLLRVPLVDAPGAVRDARVPAGSVCLGPANWANVGVDGCCDDVRDPNMLGPSEDILNPYFDPRVFRKEHRIEKTGDRVQDYPVAVLLTEETGRYFAVAAVASAAHADVDLHGGHFTLAGVADGSPNPVTGARNVVPWQSAPVPRVKVLGPAPNAGASGAPSWRIQAKWDPVLIHGDGSQRPSQAHGIDNPGHGVGVADMGPLVSYVVEVARVLDGTLGAGGYPRRENLVWETAAVVEEPEAEVGVPEDACLRIAARFGKRPRTRAITMDACSLARCGDVGYDAPGPPLCLEGPLLRRLGAGRAPP